MIKILIFLFIVEISLFYWGEYIIFNPFKKDLQSICIGLQSKKDVSNSLVRFESKQLYRVVKNASSEQKLEMMSDFARSKRLKLNCEPSSF